METTNAIWDGMLRLVEKVKAISKSMEWPELLSMVLSQVMEGITEETPDNKLFNQEAFLMRLCLRYEHFKKADFNIVTMDDKNERFRIGNYDYKTFLWGKKKVPEYIDNNFIYVPYDRLNEKEREHFKGKAVNNYE